MLRSDERRGKKGKSLIVSSQSPVRAECRRPSFRGNRAAFCCCSWINELTKSHAHDRATVRDNRG